MEPKDNTINPVKATALGFVVIIILIGIAILLPRSDTEENEVEEQNMSQYSTIKPSPSPTSTPGQRAVSDLVIEDIEKGRGEPVKDGDTIDVHYVGTSTDGTQFDSSRDQGQPFSFTVGAGQVIQGWEQGFLGMKIGGVRKLIIPPDMAYGERGAPPTIGPNETLIFEVELLSIQ